MKFCVPIIYRGQSNFIVEADTPEEAEAKARTRYDNGDVGDELGNEWEEVERIGEIEKVNPMNEMERRVRERRKEILMAGNGDETMCEHDAKEIAYSDSLSIIMNQDGEHLAETDPDLFDWLEKEVGE